jgi:hypothetical protein
LTQVKITTFPIQCLLVAVAFGLRPMPDAVAAATPVAITLDLQHPGPAISAAFEGLSFETSLLLPADNGVHYFRPDNQPLINLFHTLGIQSLRIGGNTGDRDAKKLPSEADLDSFFAFAKAADVKVIYCLRLHNGDPQTDAQTAKYIMDHYAAQMECFSIGQEPSAYPVAKKDTRPQNERMGSGHEKYQYANYAADWKRFADAIRAAVPAAKFSGPGVHNNGGWAQKFMADFGRSNHVSLVTEHLYAGGAGNKVTSPEIGRDRMLSDEFTRKYQRLYDSFVPMCISNGLAYRLEEANNYFNGGAKDVSNTFASALWGLDFLYWWAAHGAAGINFHTGDRVAAGYTLQPSKYTAFFSTTNGYIVRPLGYAIKAFDLGRHGTLVPTRVSNPDRLNLSAYAVLGDDNALYLTVINKEHGPEGHDAIISIHASKNFRQGEIISLAAPDDDVAATTGETLGGAIIRNDGSWRGNWKTLGSLSSIKVPVAGAAVIRLTNR